MLYIVYLEELETRYTSQWRRWFYDVFPYSKKIEGTKSTEELNGKNFLDPSQTNIWKSEQIIQLSNLFKEGKINDGDKFLFLDAWHYGIIALRYMARLNQKKIKIYGIWHAGSYDVNDLLGDSFKYFRFFEEALLQNLDKSFVATVYHQKLILRYFSSVVSKKVIVTGLPYYFKELDEFRYAKKTDTIVFPHRISKEKQPEILEDLAKGLQDVEVIFCQKSQLTKQGYHQILARSKIVFSASLQETWGIGIFEGLYLDAIPCVPNRLSYPEMYNEAFLYPSDWTISFNNYSRYKDQLIEYILYRLNNYDMFIPQMNNNKIFLEEKYCRIDDIFKEVNNE